MEYDETGGHIDNVLAFADRHTMILSYTDDKRNAHYGRTHAIYEKLKDVTDADGRNYKIIKIPVPDLYIRTENDCEGITSDVAALPRRKGDKVLASYVNFALVNGAVIAPQFGVKQDAEAVNILRRAFPQRQIIPFYSKEAILGGGGLHCLTKHIN